METRRILTEKRYILSVIALLIINFALFQYNQAGTWEILGDDMQRELFIQNLTDKQREEHEQFYQRLDNVSDEADRLLGISIFADEDSIAYKNINKTISDYDKLVGVELSDINDYAVEVFINYDGIYVIGLIIILLTVTAFLEERKNGLWNLIYATGGGRRRLCVKRGVILLAVSLLNSLLLVGGTLGLSFMNYGGADILWAPVQSVGMLQNVMMTVTLFEFIVYYMVVYGVCLFVNGLVIWLIMSSIRNKNLSVIIIAGIYFVEWIIYSLFIWSNPLSILKYSNLYFLANPKEAYKEYTNFSCAGTLINLGEYVPALLVTVSVITYVIHIAVSECIRPVKGTGRIGGIYNSMCDSLRRVVCVLRLAGLEAYKQLVHRKGLIIICIFAAVTVGNIDRVMLMLSPARELLDEFYDEYTGVIDGRSLAAYEEIELQVNELYEQGNSEHNAMCSMYEMLKEQKLGGDSLRERGIEPWFMNDRGYKLLFNGQSMFKRVVDGIILTLAVILISSSVYITEKNQGMKYLIRSTPRGRKSLFVRKSVVTIVITCLFSVFMYGTQIYEVLLKYKLAGLNAPVQNIGILNSIEYNISVAGFIGLWLISRLMLMLVVSCVVMYISVRGRTAERVYMLSLLMVVFGVADAVIIYVTQNPNLYVAVTPIVAGIIIVFISLLKIGRAWTGKEKN